MKIAFFPISLVPVSVGDDLTAYAMRFVVDPLALVHISAFPDILASSVPFSEFPLTDIDIIMLLFVNFDFQDFSSDVLRTPPSAMQMVPQ